MMTTSLTLPPVLSLITCSLPRVITNCQDCMLRRLPSIAPQGQLNQGLWLLESVSVQLYPIKIIILLFLQTVMPRDCCIIILLVL